MRIFSDGLTAFLSNNGILTAEFDRVLDNPVDCVEDKAGHNAFVDR